MQDFGDVTRDDIEDELKRRGVVAVTAPASPTVPRIPEGPTQPVIVVPPRVAPPYEPLLPRYPIVPVPVEETPSMLFPPGVPEVAPGPPVAVKRPLPKALVVSAILLFALIVFAEKGPEKRTRRKPEPRETEEEEVEYAD